MRRLIIPLLFLATPLAADSLSDLRSTLQKFPAKAKFAASATFQVTENAQEKAANARNGSATFDVESDASGLSIHLPKATLDAAEAEQSAKKRDAKSATPTRTALADIATFDVIDTIDSGSMLLSDLDQGTLVSAKPAELNGNSTTLVIVKVKPTIITTRIVKEPKIELRVWVGGNGIPLAAERNSTFSASMMFVSATNARKEHWDFAVAGDRLYAAKSSQENKISAVGKSAVSKRAVTVTPK